METLLTEVFPPATGGSGRWLFEIYRRLHPSSVAVIAGHHPRASEFDQGPDLAITRIPLAFPSWGCFDLPGFRHYWRTFRLLQHHFSKRRPTAVHCGKLLPEGWLAWMLRLRYGIPYWIFVHGEELALGQRSRQMAWMMRRVLSSARGVIANSHNTARLLTRDWQVRGEQLKTFHPGVDATYFAPAPQDASFRERVGWRERKVVLTVGRLQKRKGHDMLIRALPAICRQVPDVLYAIVGDGEERESLTDLARREGVGERVQFLGEAGDDLLRSCYQQCDLFALPNRDVNGDFEGFGMVLVEAQACGKPVIAGASGGTGETMDEPRTGIRVACDTPEALGERVVELLLDPARADRMGAAARQWVLQQFDWDALAQQMGDALGVALNPTVAAKADAGPIVEPSVVARAAEARGERSGS